MKLIPFAIIHAARDDAIRIQKTRPTRRERKAARTAQMETISPSQVWAAREVVAVRWPTPKKNRLAACRAVRPAKATTSAPTERALFGSRDDVDRIAGAIPAIVKLSAGGASNMSPIRRGWLRGSGPRIIQFLSAEPS